MGHLNKWQKDDLIIYITIP